MSERYRIEGTAIFGEGCWNPVARVPYTPEGDFAEANAAAQEWAVELVRRANAYTEAVELLRALSSNIESITNIGWDDATLTALGNARAFLAKQPTEVQR